MKISRRTPRAIGKTAVALAYAGIGTIVGADLDGKLFRYAGELLGYNLDVVLNSTNLQSTVGNALYYVGAGLGGFLGFVMGLRAYIWLYEPELYEQLLERSEHE